MICSRLPNSKTGKSIVIKRI